MFVESEELDKYPLASIGPRVEHHSLFPERTNFEVCEIVTPHLMRVRVWERGAGITLACGTGACASAVVATSAGRVQSPVQVELPGGTLVINWDGSGPVLMTGPAEYVFTGTLPIGRPAQLSEVVHRLEKRELGLVGSAL
jgi:diaminopimelate epimerase